MKTSVIVGNGVDKRLRMTCSEDKDDRATCLRALLVIEREAFLSAFPMEFWCYGQFFQSCRHPQTSTARFPILFPRGLLHGLPRGLPRLRVMGARASSPASHGSAGVLACESWERGRPRLRVMGVQASRLCNVTDFTSCRIFLQGIAFFFCTYCIL